MVIYLYMCSTKKKLHRELFKVKFHGQPFFFLPQFPWSSWWRSVLFAVSFNYYNTMIWPFEGFLLLFFHFIIIFYCTNAFLFPNYFYPCCLCFFCVCEHCLLHFQGKDSRVVVLLCHSKFDIRPTALRPPLICLTFIYLTLTLQANNM